MRNTTYSLVLLLIFTIGQVRSLNAQELYPDVKVIEHNRQYMILEWTPQELQLKKVSDNGRTYLLPDFAFGQPDGMPGQPAIPWRTLTIGIPENGSLVVQILVSEKKEVRNAQLAPIPQIGRDKNGVTMEELIPNTEAYSSDRFLPQQIFRLQEPTFFRDIPIQYVQLTPVQYNPSNQTLILFTKLRLKISYRGDVSKQARFRMRGKLDRLYDKMILNFQEARQWQVTRPYRLAKTAFLPHGTWYRITVKEDGWYKITPTSLELAGIDINNLSINSLQMFNNGGHELSVNVNSEYYNPPYTQEIPIQIFDLNGNNLFDGNDYLLFFGKSVNGWFYNPSTKDFSYQKHTYATENYYWLTISGNNGARLSEQTLTTLDNPITASFFIDRFHYENDLYNILASGPDWYGHRFYGRSQAYTVTFNLPFFNTPGGEAAFAIQFKGGSGSKYSEKDYYSYTFNASLNTNRVMSNLKFSRSLLKSYTKNYVDLSYFKTGENQLLIQYEGNSDDCFAFLDWFEFYYPRSFAAQDDQLTFFTGANNKPTRYTVTGLSAKSDYFVYDVSDPINPQILLSNQTSQEGKLTFDLPAADYARQIWVTSLSSPTIKNVAALEPVERDADLLATSNQADYLIITHKSFVPYAEKMAARRPNLTTKVVTVQDIYLDFNSGVQDPTAIRNFIRYAYNQWQDPSPSYVLFYGDAHYDYRHIIIPDTIRVPSMEIFDEGEVDSRTTDNYFVDLNYNNGKKFGSISPDLAAGRIPIESTLDAERYEKKISTYEQNANHDGWQTLLTFVADDNERPGVTNEWMHQNDTEEISRLTNLQRFNINKI